MTARVYTTAEVCAILRCGRTYVYELAKAKRIIKVLRGRYSAVSEEL